MKPRLTTEGRLIRGQANSLGWRELESAPGEPHPQNAPNGEVLACFWHLSDLHLCDAESPARIPYLDRYADPDSSYKSQITDVGTYRPQEILTAQVAISMVETVNALDQGPVTGALIDAILVTGDITDNAQINELMWYATIIEGGSFIPASGGPVSTWCGVSEPEHWDEHYWHPDGPPAGFEPDRPTRLFGFPKISGLIEAARSSCISPGLNYEVLSVHGNHDALLQGTVAPDRDLREQATGSVAILSLSDAFNPLNIVPAISSIGPTQYLTDPAAPCKRIPSDPLREPVHPGDFAHVFQREKNYWTQMIGQIKMIALDTVNPHGGWQGSLDEIQFAWLQSQLVDSQGTIVVVTSHHPSPSLTNDYSPTGAQRILGPEVISLLLQFPNVIMWIAGHVHFHAAIRHGDDHNWMWEVTTSSLIDWPQQGRIFEFIKLDERVHVVSTVVDHNSSTNPLENLENSQDPDNLLNTRLLAGISRLLAANDYQHREEIHLNEIEDEAREVRNVIWEVNFR